MFASRRFGFRLLLLASLFSFFLIGCGQDSGGNTSSSGLSTNTPDIVVKTDSATFDAIVPEGTGTRTGLSSTAYFPRGGSGFGSMWAPRQEGIYELFVYSPSDTPARADQLYKVYYDGRNFLWAHPSGNAAGGWSRISAMNGDASFPFTEDGFVTLSMGNEEDGFPDGTSPANINPAVSIAVDALRFSRIGDIEPPVEPADPDVSVVSPSTVASMAASTTATKIASVNAIRFTGQPDRAPATASNRFKNGDFLQVDSVSEVTWTISGRGFGTRSGAVTFSNNSIRSKRIISWSDSRITFVATSSIEFEYDSNLMLTVWVSNGSVCRFGDQFRTKAVGMIKNRGFGQCTWYVAYMRQTHGKSIPSPRAYDFSGWIGATYEPNPWDGLIFRYASTLDQHVGVIGPVVNKQISRNSRGESIVTYTFEVWEMNAAWDEAVASPRYQAKFQVNLNTRTIVNEIGCKAGIKFIANKYWR